MKKTNNKGFSLVELIIVVAIMAILIGVLAPQYIKYVERSRLAADNKTADDILTSVQTALADEDYQANIVDADNVVFSSTGIVASANLVDAVVEYFGLTTAELALRIPRSNERRNQTFRVDVDPATVGTGFTAVGEWTP